MTIYYIAVTSWDGSRADTFDYIRPFLTKQKRDEALKKMEESPAYKRGDLWLYADEDEIEDAPEEAEEGTYNNSDWGTPCIDLPSPLELERFDKVRIIIVKEDSHE